MGKIEKKRPGQAGSEKNKDRRIIRFEIHLTEQEYKEIETKAILDGESSVAKYARQALARKSSANLETSKRTQAMHLKLLGVLGRIGGNINQITRSLNRHRPVSIEMVEQVAQIQKGIEALVAVSDLLIKAKIPDGIVGSDADVSSVAREDE